MTEAFIRNALDRGEEGALWLEKIPQLIYEFEGRWNIKVGPPFDLSYNYVACAALAGGSHAVLKIGFPADKEFQTEIDALIIYNGEGAARLFEADREKSVILMERLDPGIPLSSLEDDEDATRILASVMKKLWKPLPSDHNFPHISDWTGGIERLRRRFNGTAGPLPSYLLDKTEELFRELIHSMSGPVLIHGDLHHGNVLSAGREPWLAIDPKGVVAEPAYETAAMLRNPQSVLSKKTDPGRILRRRIVILSEQLGIDPQRVQKWGISQTVLSAIWSIEDHGRGWEYQIEIAKILDQIIF
jgi:streptomycin 6-kinase